MHDDRIVELYWSRDEQAIGYTAEKYGAYCSSVAGNILHSPQDREECVNDTWLRAWNGIPPQRPGNLKMFLAKITRNLAFDRYKAQTAQKRNAGMELVLHELEECIPAAGQVEDRLIARELAACINGFVRGLPVREGNVFLRRYFFGEAPGEIGERYAISPGNVAVILARTRKKLRAHLEKEGYHL